MAACLLLLVGWLRRRSFGWRWRIIHDCLIGFDTQFADVF
jgi:hypothetical protein